MEEKISATNELPIKANKLEEVYAKHNSELIKHTEMLREERLRRKRSWENNMVDGYLETKLRYGYYEGLAQDLSSREFSLVLAKAKIGLVKKIIGTTVWTLGSVAIPAVLWAVITPMAPITNLLIGIPLAGATLVSTVVGVISFFLSFCSDKGWGRIIRIFKYGRGGKEEPRT